MVLFQCLRGRKSHPVKKVLGEQPPGADRILATAGRLTRRLGDSRSGALPPTLCHRKLLENCTPRGESIGYYSSNASGLGVSGPTRHHPCRRRRACIHAVCRQTHGRWTPRRATGRYTTLRRIICKIAGSLELCCQLAVHLLITNCIANSSKIAIGVVGRTST